MPLSPIITGPLFELLAIVSCPEKLPEEVGVNCTFRSAVCPGFNVIGAERPEYAKPEPLIAIEVIVTAEVPDEVRVIDCSAGDLSRTLPNGTLDALAVSTVLPGPNCKAKLLATPPPVAVSVTVWLVLTALTLAENDALMAPGGTVTLAGTDTDPLLLESETVKPLYQAAP